MKLKSLLFIVTLLLSCLFVRADNRVVFEEHFVAETTDPSSVGYYEFIKNEEGDERSLDGEGALFIFNRDGTLDSLTYAQVLADNVSVPVKSIEYHKDGFLYIFTEENGLSGASDVSVSFTNPTDDKQIKMNGKIESTASIFDFEDYEATYNAALNDVSPCPTYSVSLDNDTEDADNWTIKPTIATTTGVPAGTTVTATYKGTKKVKSVKVVKKASAVPSSASH